uniref:Uncharacterized protein n=1 Tax=viral metagenome TaxID=1070528 RepID=A0A6C0CUX5_9ZZZZ
MGRKATWLNEGSDDIRGFVENDDLKELFYDPTKNKLDQFEQIMKLLGIKYNKSVYDVFVEIFKYVYMLFLFAMSIFYLALICYVVYVMFAEKDVPGPKFGPKLAGVILLHMFITFYLSIN